MALAFYRDGKVMIQKCTSEKVKDFDSADRVAKNHKQIIDQLGILLSRLSSQLDGITSASSTIKINGNSIQLGLWQFKFGTDRDGNKNCLITEYIGGETPDERTSQVP